MKLVYKQSALQKIGEIAGTFFLILPLIFAFLILIAVLEAIGVNLSDMAFIIIASVFGILYLFILIFAIIGLFDAFYIELTSTNLIIYESKKKQYNFNLNDISLGYSTKESDSSYNAILKILDSNNNEIEINCSPLGKYKFENLLNKLKIKDQATKLN